MPAIVLKGENHVFPSHGFRHQLDDFIRNLRFGQINKVQLVDFRNGFHHLHVGRITQFNQRLRDLAGGGFRCLSSIYEHFLGDHLAINEDFGKAFKFVAHSYLQK